MNPVAVEEPSPEHGGSGATRVPTPRLGYIDVARGIAALAVVLYHGLHPWFPDFNAFCTRAFYLGGFGYSTFFILSGYVITLSLRRTPSPKQFAVGRLTRIIPLFWSVLAVGAVGAFMGWLGPGPHFMDHFARNVAVNVTTFQQLLNVPNLLQPFWTLSYESAFYVLVAIALFAKQSARIHLLFWPIFVLLAAIVARQALKGIHPHDPSGLRLFLLFLLGAYVSKADQHPSVGRGAVIAAVCLTGLYIAQSYVNAPAEPGEISAWADCWAMVGAVAFLAVLHRYRHVRHVDPLIYLGTISYSVYLIHALLLSIRFVQSSLIACLVAMGITIPLSALTYRYIEVPGINLGKRLRRAES